LSLYYCEVMAFWTLRPLFSLCLHMCAVDCV
jgi:hypothetical protein